MNDLHHEPASRIPLRLDFNYTALSIFAAFDSSAEEIEAQPIVQKAVVVSR